MANTPVKYDLMREDGRLERVCEHGVGHPVGHIDPNRINDEYLFVHGCDGCCEHYERQQVEHTTNTHDKFVSILRQMEETHAKKSADYGTDEDSLANVRASQEWGMPAWVGCMVRATDKIKRLQSFAKKGYLANEGARDAFMDLAVYSIIGLILYDEETVSSSRREPNVWYPHPYGDGTGTMWMPFTESKPDGYIDTTGDELRDYQRSPVQTTPTSSSEDSNTTVPHWSDRVSRHIEHAEQVTTPATKLDRMILEKDALRWSHD